MLGLFLLVFGSVFFPKKFFGVEAFRLKFIFIGSPSDALVVLTLLKDVSKAA